MITISECRWSLKCLRSLGCQYCPTICGVVLFLFFCTQIVSVPVHYTVLHVVEALVLFELFGVTTGFATLWALQALALGAIAAVDVLVPLEVLHAAETFAAGAALVRPLACVDALVTLQVTQAAEAAAALRTPVRPLARVDQLVALQRARVHEALATQFTAVGPLAAGHAFMVLQGPSVAEGVAAGSALEWLVLIAAGSRTHVLLQVLSGIEATTTLRAKMQEVSTLPA